MRKLLMAAPSNIMPLLAFGGFAGIRSAEIQRLEWQDIIWDRDFIEIKGHKAKTKSRRLVPLRENLKAWLAPFRQEEGYVCKLAHHSVKLNYVGEKAGFGWRQNALRHSYKTTEFWGTIVFYLANVALFVFGTIDATWAVTASGIVQSVYSIARGIAKRHD